MSRLTKKQRVFIDEYLQCWNATEAARRAGYSEKTARSIGCENLTKPDIANEIEARVKENAMSADEAIIKLGEHARGDIGDFFKFHPGVDQPYIDLSQAKDKLHLLKKFKRDPSGRVEIELYDAQSALVTILKAHGVFVDRSEVKQSGKLEIEYVNDWRHTKD